MKGYLTTLVLSLFIIGFTVPVQAQGSTVTLDEFLAATSCEDSSDTIQYNNGPITFLGNNVSCGDFSSGQSLISCQIPEGNSDGVIHAASGFNPQLGFSGELKSFGNSIICAETSTGDSSGSDNQGEQATTTPTPVESQATPTPVTDSQSEPGKLPDSGAQDYIVFIVAVGFVAAVSFSGAPKRLYRKIMFDA